LRRAMFTRLEMKPPATSWARSHLASLVMRSAICIAALLLVASAWLTLENLLVVQSTLANQLRTAQLAGLLSTLKDAETGQRGFLLTGKPVYLEPYEAARKRLDADFARLEQGPPMDRKGQAHLDRIRNLAAIKLTELEQTIDLRRSGQTEAALDVVLTDQGRQVMDAIRAEVDALQVETEARLAHANARARSPWIWSGVVGLAALAAVLLGGVALIQHQASREMTRGNAELRRFTRAFGLAHGMLRNTEGRITFWGTGAERMYGYGPEEALGTVSHELLRTEFSRPREEIEAALARDGTWQGEIVQRRKNGTELVLASHWALHRDAVDQVDVVIEVNSDITALQRSERALRDNEERLRLAQEAGGIGIWYWVPETGEEHFSDELHTIYGLPPGTIRTDEQRLAVIHPDDRARMKAERTAAIQAHAPFDLEFRVKRASDGEERWINSKGRAYHDPAGHITHVLGVSIDVTERKRIEAAARKSEALLRLFIERAPAAIAMFDENMRYLAASCRYLRDYGLDVKAGPAALLGCNHYELFPDLPDKWRKVHARVLAGETVSAEDDPFPRANGHTDWVRWEMAPWHREDGSIGGAVLFSEVVTERKKAEEALRRSEATLSAVLNALPVGVIIADAQGRIIRDNAANRELWGIAGKPATWEGYSDWIGWWPETDERIKPDEWAMARALLRGETTRGELVEYQPFGSEERRFYLNNAAPVRDEAGRIVAAVVAELDVTEGRRSEQERQRSNAVLRTIIETAPGLIYAKDRQGRMMLANPAVLEVLGKSWAEVEGRTALEYLDDRAQAEALMENDLRVMESGEVHEVEELVGGSEGQARVWLSTKTPLRDSQGNIEGLVGLSVEITQRKRVEERLQLLVNELNHRVKNTLATVQSIAVQTLRGANEAVRRALEARLLALASAHDVLTREGWAGANLDDVVTELLAPHGGRKDRRFLVFGPAIWLRPRAALALAMGLHELTTNAVKYGALSPAAAHGSVEIRWEIRKDRGSRLRLTWTERGGPVVSPPGRRGFGTTLVERSLAQDLGGVVALNFAPGGVECTIEVSFAKVVGPAEVVPFPRIGRAVGD
jgi:PAS domain S-box-containing protein